MVFAALSSSLLGGRSDPVLSDGSLAPLVDAAHPVLSRADPSLADHRSFLLFAHEPTGALDTAARPDLHGRVAHKMKSGRSMWNTLRSAGAHAATRLFGAQTGQTKTSLKHLPNARFKVQNKASSPNIDSGELQVTYLVHFHPDVVLNSATLASFTAQTGLTVSEYFPHHSYILVASEGQVNRARQTLDHEFVDWIGEYPNEAKVVSADLARLVQLAVRDQEEHLDMKELAVNIQLQPLAEDQPRTMEQLQETAALMEQFLAHHALPKFHSTVLPSFSNDLIIMRSTGSVKVTEVVRFLRKLTELVEVSFIEHRRAHKLHNEIASSLTQSGSPTGGPNNEGRPIWAKGIKGENQIVGCADSGNDWDHCMFNGPGGSAPTSTVNGAARKVIAYVPFGDTSDDSNGHGTHVTGSICGNALDVTADSGQIASHSGQAPAAKLYFQDIGVTGGGLSGLDKVGDLGSGLFAPAFNAGARIHSDSWGSSDNTYTTEAQSVDRFIFQSGGKTDKHMLILVAAGNDGLKQGSVQSTVGSPATAKNILAVGASQTSNAGWQASTGYTDWAEKRRDAAEQLGEDPNTFDCCSYTSNPVVPKYCCQAKVKADIASSPAQHSEGNMADFSSRGPTADGRVKPEIVAPGQYIVSAKSDGAKTDANQCTSVATALLSMAGTSMATPTLAGNAALVRQYLTEGWYPGGTKGSSAQFSDPSAALMSAILINGAQSLTGTIDRNNDGEIHLPLSNGIFPLSVFQGFGRVTLDRSLWFAGETRYRQWFEDQRVSMETGVDEDYCLTANANGVMKATLVWHDAPGSVGGGVAAVNNLDLYMGTSVEDAVAGNFVVRRDVLNNAESGSHSVQAGEKFFVSLGRDR
jgi:subtilisin family serine protease